MLTVTFPNTVELSIDGEKMCIRDRSTGGKADHFTGIGIKNVDDRIKLLYGAQYGVSISSEPGKGTAVTITIPAQEKESKDPTNL